MNKKYLLPTLLAISSLWLASCTQNDDHAGNAIKVGTIAGPETSLMEVAREHAKEEYDLDIIIVEFTDYIMPNAALQERSIDANAYQHVPYLEAAMQANPSFDFITIAKTFLYPMGVYSETLTDLSELSDGALIAIPNDPSNSGRALLLLQTAGLIHVNPEAGYTPTPHDITDNPKQLRFKELESAQLPRVLRDVDIAVINTNYAVPGGLSPTEDAILLEDADSPYANIIVVNRENADNEKFAYLIEAYQSAPVAEKAQELFGEQAIPAWD